MKKHLFASAALSAAFLVFPAIALADTVSVDFENPPYITGTIHLQDGWSSFGAAGGGCAVYDHEVDSALIISDFGLQSLRMSNAVTSGCFGDQTFSKPLVDEAGETAAYVAVPSGTRQNHFEAQWEFASAVPGDGVGVGDDFVLTNLVAGLDRTVKHTIRIEMDLIDGPRNDVVKVYVDGVLEHTGTSWEDYFRWNQGPGDSEETAPVRESRVIRTMLFRTGGTAAPATLDKGFLIDNLTASSGDDDGVLGDADLCPATTSDVGTWSEDIGTNRWELGGDNRWYQNKKGGLQSGAYDISNTYGCSGQQILDLVSALTGEDMEGHYKYGLSNSVLANFIEDGKDGVIDGINSDNSLETVTVPANDVDGVLSLMNLASGQDYAFKASGTAFACSELGCTIEFDAEYSTSDASTWVDGVAPPYDSYGLNLLDLMVDAGFVNWDDDATYNADHVYWYEMTGTGVPVSFQVYDVYYPNNTGNLTVDIYAKLW